VQQNQAKGGLNKAAKTSFELGVKTVQTKPLAALGGQGLFKPI
jgi:hypothetical protein